ETPTYEKIRPGFDKLPADYFSLGQGVEYYQAIASLTNNLRAHLLAALRDIVAQPDPIEALRNDKVFGTSLLRDTSLSIIKGQYARVLNGQPALTNFKFEFVRANNENLGSIRLLFEVQVESTPSTNIHAIIGRNGVGK